MTADGVKTYVWDAENRLVEVKQGGNTLATFAYDGAGRRATKSAGGTSTSFVYDGPQFLEERPTGGTTKRYFYGLGIDRPLAEATGAATNYFSADHLGSIAQVTDAAGAPILTRQYDAWGNPVQGSAASGYAFTGREWDAETGLYYYRARYYDPRAGRFISEDPIRFFGGMNFYLYVENQPLNWTDPLGLDGGSGGQRPMFGPPAKKNLFEIFDDARKREQPPEDRSNRRNHCIANCQMMKDSDPFLAPIVSATADYFFFTDETFPWVAYEPDPGDRAANACGREGARRGMDCVEWCTDQMKRAAPPWRMP